MARPTMGASCEINGCQSSSSRAQVARLEEREAALAAALAAALEAVRPITARFGPMRRRIDVAPSDTGEGWPEVREQVRQGLHEIWSMSAYPSPFYKKVKEIVGQLIRTLDTPTEESDGG